MSNALNLAGSKVDMIANAKAVILSGMMSGYRGSAAGNMGGEWVQRLESEFSEWIGVKHAIATSSATTALHTALLAVDLQNLTVRTTPMSFSASASCIRMANGTPWFTDVDAETFNMDFKIIPPVLDMPILGVHLMGHPLDIDAILRLREVHGLLVIEDASQAIGATYKGRKVGTFGDCGIFSFNQSKPITSGEGGMLVTNNDEIARKARLIRNHGETQDNILGYNYRLTELQAAVLLPQLAIIDEMNQYRRELASYLSERLGQIPGITPPVVREGYEHTFYTYAVKVDPKMYSRNSLQRRLNDEGVYFGNPDYGKPLYLLPGYADLGLKEKHCPVAEDLWKNRLMVTDKVKWPTTKNDLDRWVDVFRRVTKNDR